MEHVQQQLVRCLWHRILRLQQGGEYLWDYGPGYWFYRQVSDDREILAELWVHHVPGREADCDEYRLEYDGHVLKVSCDWECQLDGVPVADFSPYM